MNPAILKILAAKGMGLLVSAIEAKGVEFIEQKLSIKLPKSEDDITPSVATDLKSREVIYEAELMEYALERARVDASQLKVQADDVKDARDSNNLILRSDDVSAFVKITPYIIDCLVVLSTIVLVGIILFMKVPEENKELAYMALGSLLTMCTSTINFHRGSTSRSHQKDSTIEVLAKRGV